MLNCNQNYRSYKKIIKYKLWLQRLDIQTIQWKQFVGLCKTQQALQF